MANSTSKYNRFSGTKSTRNNQSSEPFFLPWYAALDPTSGSTTGPTLQTTKFGYSENLLSNWTTNADFRYDALVEAISAFGDMPENSDYYIDLITKDNAISILSKIQNNINTNPPKLMTQDGDSAIFTWDSGVEKIYLIISGDEVSFLRLNRETSQRDEHILAENGDVPVNSLVSLLNSDYKSGTK